MGLQQPGLADQGDQDIQVPDQRIARVPVAAQIVQTFLDIDEPHHRYGGPWQRAVTQQPAQMAVAAVIAGAEPGGPDQQPGTPCRGKHCVGILHGLVLSSYARKWRDL